MRKIDFITDFFGAWERHDIDAIVEAFTPDAVYHNVPMEPLVGTQAIRAWLVEFHKDVVSSSLQHILGAEAGDIAFSEHFDTFILRDGRTKAVALVGVFEFRDGKIAKWRDYFDLCSLNKQLGSPAVIID